MVIALCVSASLVFHNTYYEYVYISGSSMSPTLTGSKVTISPYGDQIEAEGSVVECGIADAHKAAINNIKRVSIISTYYYNDYDAEGKVLSDRSPKIKRVIAMPNETFKIEGGLLYLKDGDEFKNVPYTFETEPSVNTGYQGKDLPETTLSENQYWVLGDHRDKSRDCGTLNTPIEKSYITAVLIAIEGQAKLKLRECVCSSCGEVFSSGLTCSKCGAKLIKQFDLANKRYHWPKYY